MFKPLYIGNCNGVPYTLTVLNKDNEYLKPDAFVDGALARIILNVPVGFKIEDREGLQPMQVIVTDTNTAYRFDTLPTTVESLKFMLEEIKNVADGGIVEGDPTFLTHSKDHAMSFDAMTNLLLEQEKEALIKDSVCSCWKSLNRVSASFTYTGKGVRFTIPNKLAMPEELGKLGTCVVGIKITSVLISIGLTSGVDTIFNIDKAVKDVLKTCDLKLKSECEVIKKSPTPKADKACTSIKKAINIGTTFALTKFVMPNVIPMVAMDVDYVIHADVPNDIVECIELTITVDKDLVKAPDNACATTYVTKGNKTKFIFNIAPTLTQDELNVMVGKRIFDLMQCF